MGAAAEVEVAELRGVVEASVVGETGEMRTAVGGGVTQPELVAAEELLVHEHEIVRGEEELGGRAR